MAWIESHQALKDHPKTRKLARLMGVSVPTAIGHLHCFWWWALEYAPDGDLAHVDPMDVAIGAMWEGDDSEFFFHMSTAGFIDYPETNHPVIHDWSDYAGKLIDRRKANTERKRAARTETSPACPADVRKTDQGHPQPVTTPSEATVPNRTVQNSTEPKETATQKGEGKRVTKITPQFRTKMRAEFSQFGERVDAIIDQALGHKAVDKYHDLQAYVRGWLRRENDRASPAQPKATDQQQHAQNIKNSQDPAWRKANRLDD